MSMRLWRPWWVLIAAALGGQSLPVSARTPHPLAEATGERTVLFYRNPMNPAITSATPAKDEMGMDYIPVYADAADGAEEEGRPSVTVRPEVINNLGVRVAPVVRADLARPIEAVGYVEFDERKLSHVHLRASGWVEDLRVRSVGAPVTAGELLFRFYSPELVNAQKEFVQALESGQASLWRASEERLRAAGIPTDTIRGLREQRQVQQLVPVYARHSGVVAELNVREGMYVEPALETMTLADLSSVWVIVDVFERQASWLKEGQRVELRLPALPGRTLEGQVEYLYPTLDPRTRTLRARLRFDNGEGVLRPNMYAEAVIFTEPRPQALTIPRAAVIETADERRVVLFQGAGRFKPVAVRLGIESGERVEVLEGLKEGQQVVVSAQFLIDSESNLKASLRRLTAVTTPALQTLQASGKVNRVDLPNRKVNLTHDPIPAIGWPAMTMEFAALPEADLSGLHPGQRVTFELKEVAELDFRLGAIEPLAEAGPATEAAAKATADPALYWGRGVLRQIDGARHTVTIAHEPMPALGWPPMTMTFEAASTLDLSPLSVGTKVRFQLRALDAVTYRLEALEPVAAEQGRAP